MKKYIILGAVIASIAAMSLCASAETTDEIVANSDEAVATVANEEVGVDEDYVVDGDEGAFEDGDLAAIAIDDTENTSAEVVDATDTADVEVADADAETSADEKGSPDTGVAGVAGVAGVGIAACGIAILASKRHK